MKYLYQRWILYCLYFSEFSVFFLHVFPLAWEVLIICLFTENSDQLFPWSAMSSSADFLLSPLFGDRCHCCLVFPKCVQPMSTVLKWRPPQRNVSPGTQMLIIHKWFRAWHYSWKNLLAAFPGMFARALWFSRPALVPHWRGYLLLPWAGCFGIAFL